MRSKLTIFRSICVSGLVGSKLLYIWESLCQCGQAEAVAVALPHESERGPGMHIDFSRQGAKDRNELCGGHAHTYIYMPERKIDTNQLKILDMRKAGAGIATFLFLLFCGSMIMLLCSYVQYIKCSLVHRPLHSLVHYI